MLFYMMAQGSPLRKSPVQGAVGFHLKNIFFYYQKIFCLPWSSFYYTKLESCICVTISKSVLLQHTDKRNQWLLMYFHSALAKKTSFIPPNSTPQTNIHLKVFYSRRNSLHYCFICPNFNFLVIFFYILRNLCTLNKMIFYYMKN